MMNEPRPGHQASGVSHFRGGDDVTEAQIKHMVERFLSWKLPDTFCPDGGISFDPVFNKGTPYEARHEPVGTNVLTASEADAMVRHMVEGLPT